MASRDDLFDSVVFFEENCQKQGYKDGFDEGRFNGWREGFEIGLQKGNELGAEIGFYKGFVLTYLTCYESGEHDTCRVKTKLESLWKLLSQNWGDNTKDLTTELETVKAKFKQICSILNIKTEYVRAKTNQLSF